MRTWHGGTRVALVVWTCLVVGGVAARAAAADPPLALDAILSDARDRNPELAAARERAAALRQTPRQAAAWDDPMLSWEAWNTPNSFRIDRADNNIFKLSQKIPFPGKRRLAGEVAAHDAARGTSEAERVELALVAAVKTAYYALWETHAKLALLERDRDLVTRLTRAVERKYGTGEASQADALRLQVELTHLANQIETQRLVIERARADLAALLSRPSSAVRGAPVTPAPPRLALSLDALVATALATRPDVRGEDEAIARDATAVELAHKNRLPDFEVSVSRFVNDDMPDGFGASAAVSLPIFNRAKYAAALDEANARLAASRAEKRRVEDAVRREVERAFLATRTALLQHDLFSATHVPHAEQALRVTEGAYETGDGTFGELIDTLRGVQSVHLEHLAAQGEFERAFAELEEAVGTALPRGGAAPTHEGRHE
ncbi:MAG: TolC family protein [Deltaproteobacteria bacterium]|nr:TolC family protein [Deltaproteobacteria bacterium]